MSNSQIAILMIQQSDERKLSAFINVEKAYEALYEYVKNEWDTIITGPIPNNKKIAIKRYFDCVHEESYFIEVADLQ